MLKSDWVKKPETASRLRGRIEAILDAADGGGCARTATTGRWRGHLSTLLPDHGKVATVRHHPALPWNQVKTFMAELRTRVGMSARSLEFAILTAARTGEVRGAKWSEIDLDAAVWTVPKERMKAAGSTACRCRLRQWRCCERATRQRMGRTDWVSFPG